MPHGQEFYPNNFGDDSPLQRISHSQHHLIVQRRSALDHDTCRKAHVDRLYISASADLDSYYVCNQYPHPYMPNSAIYLKLRTSISLLEHAFCETPVPFPS